MRAPSSEEQDRPISRTVEPFQEPPMFNLPEPFIESEIAYRRSRIAEDFRAGAHRRRKHRDRRHHRGQEPGAASADAVA
jgi:hypothetical protein